MAKENIKTLKAQMKQNLGKRIPLWVSFLAIIFTAVVVAFILLRI